MATGQAAPCRGGSAPRQGARDRPPRVLDRREACPRKALAAAVVRDTRAGVTYAALSRMIGRPDGYLARFVQDGTPRALRPDEHSRLAEFFGVDERGLGIRQLWVPL